MKKIIALAAISMLSVSSMANAFPLASGNLVVVRYGDGSAALGSAATAGFLQEYTVGGSLQQTINLPTSASGGNRQFTVSGSATSEGMLTRSVDGQYLTLGGYDAAVGTLTVATTAPATNNRVIARVNAAGAIDTTTAITDLTGNIRSVVMNGNDIWATSSGNGLRGTTYASTTTSTSVASTPSNARVANIFSGQLYVDSGSAGFTGPGTVGSGLPTGSGNSVTLLSGFPTSGTHSPYDYYFSNANTVYVCDDGGAAAGGGLQKWTQSAGTWSLAYTLSLGSSTSVGCRGLTGVVNSGVATLYATTNEASNNRLVSITDTSSSATFTDLASSGTNTAFRGVEFAPVPEPATLTLLAFGAMTLIRRRR